MNFVKNEKDIRQLIPKGGGGCYIYSQNKNDKVFKIGMAFGDVFKRIRRQKSCYPYNNEFFIHFIWVTSLSREDMDGEKKARDLEKKLLTHVGSKIKGTRGNYTLSRSRSSTKIVQKEQGRRPREFRYVGTKQNLKQLINEVFMTTPVWYYMYEFKPRSWEKKYAFQFGLTTSVKEDITKTRSGRVSKKPVDTYVNSQLSALFQKDVEKWEKQNKLDI